MLKRQINISFRTVSAAVTSKGQNHNFLLKQTLQPPACKEQRHLQFAHMFGVTLISQVRRSQLYRISERLADDLAHCVTMREVAMDKARSNAAVEKLHGTHGTTTHSQYHHKIRLARADVARVTKVFVSQ